MNQEGVGNIAEGAKKEDKEKEKNAWKENSATKNNLQCSQVKRMIQR